MSKDPIQDILKQGKSTSFSFDPSQKNEISKATLDSVAREVRKHLFAKKKVHVILVKE